MLIAFLMKQSRKFGVLGRDGQYTRALSLVAGSKDSESLWLLHKMGGNEAQLTGMGEG